MSYCRIFKCITRICGLHWNIRGKRFFDLHVNFEELYNDSQLKIDLIAETVLTLGGIPPHTFEDYSKNNQLTVGKNIHNDEEAITLIVNSLSQLLKIERIILNKPEILMMKEQTR